VAEQVVLGSGLGVHARAGVVEDRHAFSWSLFEAERSERSNGVIMGRP
jgi:hypothetical protein